MEKVIKVFAVILIMMGIVGCSSSEDEPIEKKTTVTLLVSHETGYYSGMVDGMHEGMLIKEKGQMSWNPCSFTCITGFTYEKGYDYELLVTKITNNPPMADGGAYRYELIKIVDKIPYGS